MTALVNADVVEIAERWEKWAKQLVVYADLLARNGHTFDASLKLARGEVRKRAAALLRATPEISEAAHLMHRNAIEASVRVPPFIGYDQAADRYTRARVWQACAWELDPDLPEVQPRWT